MLDAQLAELVEMRYFGGMTVEDVAVATGLSEPTVKRRWQVARSWLLDALQNPIDRNDRASRLIARRWRFSRHYLEAEPADAEAWLAERTAGAAGPAWRASGRSSPPSSDRDAADRRRVSVAWRRAAAPHAAGRLC